MSDFGELPKPDFMEYSLENWGHILKVSASLTPNMFPYKVGIPKHSTFFRSIYHGVYKGEGTTVMGSHSKIRPRGRLIEHEAVLGVNDLGEIMVSREVFEGNWYKSRTDISNTEYQKHINLLRSIPLPPGWRTFGCIHSHPVDDIVNEPLLMINRNIPRINGVPLTWSGGDFKSFVLSARYGFSGFTTLGYINPNLLSFMVASKTTVDTLQRSEDILEKLKRPKWSPPYESFRELGIVLYAGNHGDKKSDKVLLERLI